MYRHLQRKHPTIYKDYNESKTLTDERQSSLSNFFFETSNAARYDPASARQKLLSRSLVDNLIIDCCLPLSIVDNESFRKFLHSLDPKFRPPSRSHMTMKMLPKLVTEKTEQVKELLNSAVYVSCTLDMWSDRNCRAYVAITAHTFVEFQSKSCLLTFREMPGSHTGSKIADLIDSVLTEYNLRSKVEVFVTDNASNMKKAFTLLSSFRSDDHSDGDIDIGLPAADSELLDDDTMWEDLGEQEGDLRLNFQENEDSSEVRRLERNPCFGHTLQLVVKDGVDQLGRDARSTVAKCCKLSSLLHQSSLVKEAFEKEFGDNRSIPQTNSTRWSSLYNQLSIVSKLDQNKLVTFMNERDLANLQFSTKDHAVLSELVSVLEPFAEATTLCQGDEIATIGVIVPSVVSLYKHLKALVRTAKYNVPVVKALLGALSTRFKGLLHKLRIVALPTEEEADAMTFGKDMFLVASVLDPVYGFIWLEEDHPGSPAVKSALRSYITDAIIHQASLVDAKHPSKPDQAIVPLENVSVACASSSTQPSLNDTAQPPETKKRRSTLFASYEHRRQIEPQRQVR